VGQHNALHRAAATLHPDDSLVAFLDDLYITTTPSRARTSLDAAVEAVADHCGIGSNLGKTRAIGACEGPPPPGSRSSATKCGEVICDPIIAASSFWAPRLGTRTSFTPGQPGA